MRLLSRRRTRAGTFTASSPIVVLLRSWRGAGGGSPWLLPSGVFIRYGSAAAAVHTAGLGCRRLASRLGRLLGLLLGGFRLLLLLQGLRSCLLLGGLLLLLLSRLRSLIRLSRRCPSPLFLLLLLLLSWRLLGRLSRLLLLLSRCRHLLRWLLASGRLLSLPFLGLFGRPLFRTRRYL